MAWKNNTHSLRAQTVGEEKEGGWACVRLAGHAGAQACEHDQVGCCILYYTMLCPAGPSSDARQGGVMEKKTGRVGGIEFLCVVPMGSTTCARRFFALLSG